MRRSVVDGSTSTMNILQIYSTNGYGGGGSVCVCECGCILPEIFETNSLQILRIPTTVPAKSLYRGPAKSRNSRVIAVATETSTL